MLCISVQTAIVFEYFEGFFEHGIFHGIAAQKENKLLNINDKKGLLIIEWEGFPVRDRLVPRRPKRGQASLPAARVSLARAALVMVW